MAKRQYTPEEARERKNARQREYAKKTGFASSKKYIAKTYKRYNVNFRVDDDQDIITKIDTLVDSGLNTTDAFRKLIRKAINK